MKEHGGMEKRINRKISLRSKTTHLNQHETSSKKEEYNFASADTVDGF